jgi:Leucine-rich repeat (LRR) protein
LIKLNSLKGIRDGSLKYSRFPVDIGNLTELITIENKNGELEGELPSSIVNLTKLSYFSIQNTRVNGTLPYLMGEMKSLYYFKLSVALLEGEIPKSICQLTALEELYLGVNKLEGISKLIYFRKYTRMHWRYDEIDRSKASGKHAIRVSIILLTPRHIPESIAKLTDMIILRLVGSLTDKNRFSGRLPLRMGEMKNLVKLFVGVPTLSGPLPEFYKVLGLTKCDLSEADYCREWDVPSYAANSGCVFEKVPKCNTDCMVLYEWIEMSPGLCCADRGISCDQEGRIITM